MSNLNAPFPWFGGKSRVANEVWQRFGTVPNYVEPFFGSGAVLLGRGEVGKTETVNDLDGFVSNFWRAVTRDPEGVAEAADWPVNELDLHARHVWLVGKRADLTARLGGDPHYHDPQIAGWWLAGICGWIGSGYCSGDGPWVEVDGRLVDRREVGGDAGKGINKKMPHVGDAGQGINKQMSHGQRGQFILDWMLALQARMRDVRVLSGDWERCLSDSVTTHHGITGIFLDPPYGEEVEQTRVYATDSGTVSGDVRTWCIENGNNKLLRIALCGYTGEGHDVLLDYGWTEHAWRAAGGYGGGRGRLGDANRHKERVYFSPACITERGLFDLLDGGGAA